MVDGAVPVHTADIGVLVAQAQIQLERSTYRALHNVFCGYQDGAVVISGRLPNYYLRQLAVTIVLGQVHGCLPVVDRVKVGNGAAQLAGGEENLAPHF
jgi:hypothetical protein